MEAVQRTPEQLREHYEIEKELANRLRRAGRAERGALYAEVYDELFRRVSHHPQWTKRGTDWQQAGLESQMRLLRRHLKAGLTFLEVGAGDCALSRRIAQKVRQVYAVEVSAELTRGLELPGNVELLLSDGCHINLPDGSVDLAYSNQLMEHIHPDDAYDQLREIYRVLKPGAIYYCITPNRISGPHDISVLYDREATGMHLKEYSARDLSRLFREVGFRKVWLERTVKSAEVSSPILPLLVLERMLEVLPWSMRKPLSRSYVLSRLLDTPVVARK